MLAYLSGLFSENMGIDLGTANTLIYIKDRGIVLEQPSVVALIQEHGQITPYAFGQQAKMMLGKTPNGITAIRPMKDGVIADFKGAEEMIKYFINLVHKRRIFVKPLIVVCVPSGSTPVERRAIYEAILSAGAKEAFLIEEPMAAAIGAQLPVTEPCGSMVVDIGGGTTEVGIISLGGVVQAKSVRVGGDKMDEAIVTYLRKKHNLLIGEATAEKIKKEIGGACMIDNPRIMPVRGRDMISGIPKEIFISESEIIESITEPINQIVQVVKTVLETAPPELAADIVHRGVTLTGGGALLPKIDEVIAHATNLNVQIADDPLNSVVCGIGKVLENFPALKHVLFKQN